ncbi:MAG TPA: archease [Gemmatimonadales bacterium]|nr:archease [Gemmatimonadales bacterium]
MTPFRFVPHTADVAVELVAQDEAGLRRAGLDALRELLVGASPVAPRQHRPVALRGADPTERLIHFLQDVLYLYDTERFVPARVTADGIEGEPFDPARHEARPEVKAVTWHGGQVRQEADGKLHATVIFDV